MPPSSLRYFLPHADVSVLHPRHGLQGNCHCNGETDHLHYIEGRRGHELLSWATAGCEVRWSLTADEQALAEWTLNCFSMCPSIRLVQWCVSRLHMPRAMIAARRSLESHAEW